MTTTTEITTRELTCDDLNTVSGGVGWIGIVNAGLRAGSAPFSVGGSAATLGLSLMGVGVGHIALEQLNQ
jgi:hypothetical protein